MSTRTITFIVTKDCQLRCKYCYLVGKKSNEKMSFSTARKACDYLVSHEQLFPEENVILDFIGGEPLLEIDLIDQVCKYFFSSLSSNNHHWKKHCTIHITTNGLLYNSYKVQRFITEYKEILDISISIDGNKIKNDINRVFISGRGSYDDIIPNVKLWIEQFEDVGTKMVISHDDLPYICDSAIHLINLGIQRLDMNTVVEDVWKEGDDKIFEEQLIKFADYIIDNGLYNKCTLYIFEQGIGHPLNSSDVSLPCGSMQLSVDNRGVFFSCLRFADFSLREKRERPIGNINDGLNLNHLRPLLSIDRESLFPSSCLKCEVASGCRWCPAENYDSSKTETIFEKALYICKMHKARVRAKNYYWNKINML